MENNFIKVNPDWLKLDLYDFKILITLSCLSENGLFKNKLKSICDFLNISSSNQNIVKIKTALNNLEEKFGISIDQKGHTWTITLPPPTPNDVIIQKEDIETIIHQEIDLKFAAPSDAAVIKLFIFLQLNNNKVKTYAEIGEEINCSEMTVTRAVKSLMLYNFKNLNISKSKISFAPSGSQVIALGTKFSIDAPQE